MIMLGPDGLEVAVVNREAARVTENCNMWRVGE